MDVSVGEADHVQHVSVVDKEVSEIDHVGWTSVKWLMRWPSAARKEIWAVDWLQRGSALESRQSRYGVGLANNGEAGQVQWRRHRMN
jgi:hypothetical protein